MLHETAAVGNSQLMGMCHLCPSLADIDGIEIFIYHETKSKTVSKTSQLEVSRRKNTQQKGSVVLISGVGDRIDSRVFTFDITDILKQSVSEPFEDGSVLRPTDEVDLFGGVTREVV
jgi:hypothetical protein